ncbi:MAG: phosphodiester glycosidase family protein [Fimbriimonadaceae bacterium]|nr:phosphodiester glycosidase family protein [Fimbriimonadaceae bacterium]
MRSRPVILATFCLTAIGLAQVTPVNRPRVWEKYIQPGLTYRMEVDPATPRVIHSIRWSQGAPGLRLEPALAGRTVYESGASNGRGTLSAELRATGAIAGINAGFFGPSGDPFGVHIVNREIISTPWPKRTAFAWGTRGAVIGTLSWEATASVNGVSVAIDGVNQSTVNNTMMLNTPLSGGALSGGPEVVHVVLSTPQTLTVNTMVTGKVTRVVKGQGSVPVEANTMVLTAANDKASIIGSWPVGATVNIRNQFAGLNMNNYDHAIGDGNLLVDQSRVAVRYAAEGFTEEFGGRRHPRTAIGQTAQGDYWLVAVDGRQSMSAGATLEEMAEIMLNLGCERALALDGGGSTTIGLSNVILNRPSDSTERAVTNFVLLFADGNQPAPVSSFRLDVPTGMVAGTQGLARLLDADGRVIPDQEVIWGCSGAAWIDQAGNLQALTNGEARVTAFSRGTLVTATIPVQAGPNGS